MLANGLLILILPNYLDSVSQGFYFAFIGFAALQVAFDFGMSQAIMQIISHEFAVNEHGKVATLIDYSNCWFKKIAITFVLTVSPLGIYYFSNSIGSGPFGWPIIWILLIALSGLNLFFSSRLTVIEGLGDIDRVAKLRSAQNIIGVTFACLVLFLGFGLFAILILPTVSVLSTHIWLKHIYVFKKSNKLGHNFSGLNKKEIFNLQWRIGLSWTCGYVVQQSISPILFREHGAIIAGKFGLTLSLFNAISMVGLSWVAIHAPKFSYHVALLQRGELLSLFKSSIYRSVIFTFFLICLLLIFLRYSRVIPSDRVMQGISLYCLAIICLANSIIFSIAILLRAHKKEPTLIVGVITGIALIGIILTASSRGVEMITIGYAALTLFVALPWTIIIGFRFIKGYYGK